MRILIAEDDRDFASLISFALEPLGHELETFDDGGEASDRLGRAPEPDLAILDLNLPGKSGLELLDEIASRPGEHQTRIILMTASADDLDKEALMSRGADLVLRKPIAFTDIERHVEALLKEECRQSK